MSYDGPGEGWREVDVDKRSGGVPHIVQYNDRGDPERWWVEDEPVPPLPTEPHTRIRVEYQAPVMQGSIRDLTLDEDGVWRGYRPGSSIEGDAVALARDITGFEVLARPVSKVLAEDEDAYFDSDDIETARREGFNEALGNVRWYAGGSPWLQDVCKIIEDRGPQIHGSD